MIDPADRGFTLGDGLFETVLVERGAAVRLDAHLARLNIGCRALGLPPPDGRDIALPDLPNEGRHALRISWSAGPGGRGLERPGLMAPRLTLSLAPAPLPGPARLITAQTVRRNAQSPASGHKTLSYLDNVLAREEARARGGDEAVMLNTAGHIACAAAANLFWIVDGQVFTPSLVCGVLPGITRARLMQVVSVQEVVAGREALERAQAVFLTNALCGVRAVESLDGRVFGPDPLVANLNDRLAAQVA